MSLDIQGISKRFGKTSALEEVSFSMGATGIVGLVGSNGAGKTTLMRILATLLKPTIGDIFLDGTNVVKHPHIMRRVLGYLPQTVPYYHNLTASEYLLYLAGAKGIPHVEAKRQIAQLLTRLNLDEVKNRSLANYSGGMRQRVGLAGALLGSPRIVIVDEPSTGLDPQQRVNLRILLSEISTRCLVLLSTHIVSDIEAVSNRLLLMKEGRLCYDGTPQKLLEKADGFVWEYVQASSALPQTQRMVSNLIHSADGVLVREVGSQKPTPSAHLVRATLEDACLFALSLGVDHEAA